MERKKLKIAFLQTGVGVRERGAEIFVLELTERLQNKYDITIFSRGKANPHCKVIKAIPNDNKIINFIYNMNPFLKRVFNKLFLHPFFIEWHSAALCAFPYLLHGNFDLIVCEAGLLGALLCRLIRKVKNVPFIDIGHGSFGRWEYWFAKQKPDIYIALTENNKRMLQDRLPHIKCVVIPNGVDTRKFNPDIEPIGLNLQRPIFLCVGTLQERVKRMDLAIKAVAKLKKGSLLILGKGRLRNELYNLGKVLLGGQRFLIKSVAHSDMPKYYNACDAFTLPSEHESFPRVILEAMACNKPVVARYIENIKEVVGDAGILCDCTNIDEYAKALEEAVSVDWNNRPRERAMKFDWQIVAKKFDIIIQEIIQKYKSDDKKIYT